MIYVLLADGFEEIEALTPVDMMRRYKIDVKTAGVGGDSIVGSHNICVKADMKVEEIDINTVEGVILPGGMPGTLNLQKDATVNKIIEYCAENDLLIGSICAAPMILGDLGLLDGRKAVCYPGYEEHLRRATIGNGAVEVCDNFITAKGAGASFEFGEAIIDYISKTRSEGKKILLQMQYRV